jgi:ABC-type sugar transport system ATPase subunit
VGHYEDVSLTLRGRDRRLTGLLGSGRTEFALSLRHEPADSGEIRLNGKPWR